MVKFTDAVRDVSGGNAKLPQSEFQKSGSLAVVDQGQGFVAGYTNDLSYQFQSESLPVIVFGDHTRAIKYIDFPFAMGADGVKVLKPMSNCDAKYIFHCLKYADIPSAGYSRHYKFLKELLLFLPSLDEQRRIAAILDKADALRGKRREAIAKLDQLLHSVFFDMFGDPECNPKNWPLRSLENLCDPHDRVNYGVVQPGAEFPGGVPVIRVGDIDGGNLDASSIKRIDPSIESAYGRSRLKGNELLISCVGSIGIVASVPNSAIGFNIARAITRVPLAKPEDRSFVQQCLLTPALQRYFKEKTRTVSQPTLNVEFVKAAKILDPPPALVGKYCQVVAGVDRLKKNILNSSDGIERNFCSIEQRAFAGTL